MLLKKGISSKIALLLSMILLLMCPNVSVLAVDPDENEEVLFLVDKQTSYGWDHGISQFAWKDDLSGGVSVVNNWVECDIEASEDRDSLVINQKNTSAYQLRINAADMSSTRLESGKIYRISMRFKLAAENYDTAPFVKARMVWAGVYADMNKNIPLTESDADKWRELVYTIDPAAHTLTATLDGDACYSGSFDAAANTNLGTPQFQLIAQNTNGQIEEKAVLNSPITWTVDYLKASAVGEGSGEETTPAPGGDVFSVDKQTSYGWDNSISQNAWKDAASGDTAVIMNWIGADIKVSEGGDALVAHQTGNSGNNFRIRSADLSSVTLNSTSYHVSLRFKLAADSYDTVPFVKARLVLQEGALWADMNKTIPITSETADSWHDLIYTINPTVHTVTATLDGAECYSSSYDPARVANLGTLMFQLIAQNTNGGTGENTEKLVTPITWTIDYFKVTAVGEGEEPTATPYVPGNDRLLIDKNMSFKNATLTQTESVGAILHEYYNAGTDKNFSQKLIEDDDKFEVKQSLSSAYQQRLQVTDPQPILLDKPITATIKFRIKADDYSKGTTAKMTLVYWAPTNQFLDMTGNIPLSADAENIDQTLVYVIDPDAGTITGKLNGQQIASAKFSTDLERFEKILFYPVVQPEGKSNTDAQDLGTTVTWTYDFFEIKRSIGEEETEEPKEGTPLEAPVSSGAWQSALYETGVGDSDVSQLDGTVLDLGKQAKFNKIVLEHDPSLVMSFSVSASRDGLQYTPITDIYAGGLPEYGGRQVYYLPTTDARYVKYNTVLIKDAKTQGILNNMTVSYTEVTDIDLSDVPDKINPAEALEYKLPAVFTDKDGDTNPANPEGIVWTVSGAAEDAASIHGRTLRISPEIADGNIVLYASDRLGKCSKTKTVAIKTDIVTRNLGLYEDSDMTKPLTGIVPGGSVYARAEISAKDVVDEKDVTLILAAYKDGRLISAAAAKAIAQAEFEPVSASVKLPDDFGNDGTLAAYLWTADSQRPLCRPVRFGGGQGLQMQNLFLPMHGEGQLTAAAADVIWTSSNPRVASVDESGSVTAKSEGFAVITAQKDGLTVGSVRAQVKPSTYVYLMIGQSNMSGTNNPVAEGVDIPISDNVKLLNKEGDFEQAQHPYRRYSGVNGIGTEYPYIGWSDASDNVGPQFGINMGYQFAEDTAAANPDINIGLVVQSSSGSSILSYEKDAAKDDKIKDVVNGYANTIERMKQALSGDAEFKGLLWHQGESDAQDASYPRRLRNLVYDLRAALDAPEVPLILGGLSETNRSAYVIHNARVREELGHIPNMGFASSTDPTPLLSRAESTAYQNDTAVWQNDYTHISAVGQIEFGHRYYQTYLDVTGEQN